MKIITELYQKIIKRLLDLFLAITAFLFLAPIMFVVGILIRIKLGGPVIFKQKRPGLDGKIFTLYKFRTMTNGKDENGNLLPDSLRLTKFGRVLRSTSLDELPELFNIIKGDMSIVGPRPLAVEYLPYYSDEERTRHSVRPGLTGLAQINGRNTASWEERFYYDIKYVNNITLLGDVSIVFKTIFMVLRRKDIGERGVDAPIDFHTYRNTMKEGASHELEG